VDFNWEELLVFASRFLGAVPSVDKTFIQDVLGWSLRKQNEARNVMQMDAVQMFLEILDQDDLKFSHKEPHTKRLVEILNNIPVSWYSHQLALLLDPVSTQR
jgi:hypothetical protein